MSERRLHVVCAWIGNTEAIAQKQYLQVTEAHFAQAAKANSAPDSAPTAQNTAQHRVRTEHAPNEKPQEFLGFRADFSAFSDASQYPQGDSNPCLCRERAMSWATRRWGPFSM
jgi:hypothetical protein